jgi:hypothetical protein
LDAVLAAVPGAARRARLLFLLAGLGARLLPRTQRNLLVLRDDLLVRRLLTGPTPSPAAK